VTHLLAAGLETQFEDDAAHPVFRPIVTPWRKALGDNADARYHDAPVHPAGTYRVRGRTAGAVYVSFTVEAGAADGAFPSGTALGRSRARPHGHVRAQPHPRHHPEARRR
jgi:hypothetical protein